MKWLIPAGLVILALISGILLIPVIADDAPAEAAPAPEPAPAPAPAPDPVIPPAPEPIEPPAPEPIIEAGVPAIGADSAPSTISQPIIPVEDNDDDEVVSKEFTYKDLGLQLDRPDVISVPVTTTKKQTGAQVTTPSGSQVITSTGETLATPNNQNPDGTKPGAQVLLPDNAGQKAKKEEKAGTGVTTSPTVAVSIAPTQTTAMSMSAPKTSLSPTETETTQITPTTTPTPEETETTQITPTTTPTPEETETTQITQTTTPTTEETETTQITQTTTPTTEETETTQITQTTTPTTEETEAPQITPTTTPTTEETETIQITPTTTPTTEETETTQITPTTTPTPEETEAPQEITPQPVITRSPDEGLISALALETQESQLTGEKTTGALNLAEYPAGIEVYLDKEHQGVTPLLIEGIDPGTYLVTLENRGMYTDTNVTIPDSGGEVTVPVTEPNTMIIPVNGDEESLKDCCSADIGQVSLSSDDYHYVYEVVTVHSFKDGTEKIPYTLWWNGKPWYKGTLEKNEETIGTRECENCVEAEDQVRMMFPPGTFILKVDDQGLCSAPDGNGRLIFLGTKEK